MFQTSKYNDENQQPDLGVISVFICSILLSLGGFIAIIASSCRRSRCTKVGGCCGINCVRDPVDDLEPGI